MKANAPEKIYRTTTYLDDDKGKTLWKTKPVAGAENIEYTRTDAFIKNACEWLEENIEEHISADGEYTVYYKEMFEEFKNYMKGE